ncbi:hypothetical protein EYF80_047794 [Liparis tanakae]|uniref:Uncharacterized protein n=1 Tax=Liparis tanakae TaxID=230148 RepID=A0A4Z2FLC4_9TELE|nr:hypothetical protein EYF80_047794 [Liparis tanakae]
MNLVPPGDTNSPGGQLKVIRAARGAASGGRCQLTLWIRRGAVVRRQDERRGHRARGVPGGVGRGGSLGTRLTGGGAGSIVLLVLGEEEAGGVAEGVGRHQLGLPLVGEAVAALSPALGPLVVLHGRGAGGAVRGHPGARVGPGSGFGPRRNRGRAPGGGGGGGGRSFGRHLRGRSCLSGRVELLIQRDVPDVDGQRQHDVWRPQTDLRKRRRSGTMEEVRVLPRHEQGPGSL